ncbi:MAG: hypothetical protein NZZ41_07135 [Candidatus Dojkabacteria bacterium]|nr:hypothetical protein [Candidatus Dojkabacteria bacterium]
MSYPLRVLSPISPAYLNISSTGFIPLGGTFTSGQIAWINLSYPIDNNECLVYMVIVQNALWTNNAYSDKIIISNPGKKFFGQILPLQDPLGLFVKTYWNNDGTVNYSRVETSGPNSGNTPVSANFIVWYDVSINSETIVNKYSSVREFMKLNNVIELKNIDTK